MVIASHDRRFLDACTTRTLFLRPGVSRIYAHPYSRARQLLAEDDAAQEAKLAKDAREVDRLRRNANELKNVGINSGSDLLLKKSKQLRERAAALEQTLTPVHAERSGDIRLANRGTHAKVMLALAGCRGARARWADAVPHRQAGRVPAGPDRRCSGATASASRSSCDCCAAR